MLDARLLAKALYPYNLQLVKIMKNKILSISISALFLTGCASGKFYKTGEDTAESRPVGCEFNIYTTSPKNEFVELGLFEFHAAYNLGIAKEQASPAVCKNGGNGLLIWEANGYGAYTKGTVVYVSK